MLFHQQRKWHLKTKTILAFIKIVNFTETLDLVPKLNTVFTSHLTNIALFNRAAAARCRQKRKHWIGSLESKAEDLQSSNSKLQGEVWIIVNHVNCLKSEKNLLVWCEYKFYIVAFYACFEKAKSFLEIGRRTF